MTDIYLNLFIGRRLSGSFTETVDDLAQISISLFMQIIQ